MSRARLWFFVVLLAAGAIGCGGDEERATQAGRLGAVVSPEQQAQLTCAETALVPPSGTCEGPWRYQKWVTPCYPLKRDAACGVETTKKLKHYTYTECRWRGAGTERMRWSNVSLPQDGVTTTSNPISYSRAYTSVTTPSTYSGGTVTPGTTTVYWGTISPLNAANACATVPTPIAKGTAGKTCEQFFNQLKADALAQNPKPKLRNGTDDPWNALNTYAGYPTYEPSIWTTTGRTVTNACGTCLSAAGCSYLIIPGTPGTYGTPPVYGTVAFGGTVPAGKTLSGNTPTVCDLNVVRYKLGIPAEHDEYYECAEGGRAGGTLACGPDAWKDASGNIVRTADGNLEKSCPLASATERDVPDVYNACRMNWGPGTPSDLHECGVVAPNDATDVFADVKPEAALNPTCTTLNADEQLTPGQMYDRLEKNLHLTAPGVDQASLQALSIRKLKLLLETHGAELSDAQRDLIYGFYQSRPDLQPPCGTSWNSPGAPDAALDASMQACHRALQYPPTLAASAARLRDQCVDAGKAASLLAGDPRRPAYLDAYRAKILPFLDRVLGIELPHVAEKQVNGELQSRLELVNRWYGYASAAGLYGGADEVWNAASDVVGATWRGVYGGTMSILEAKLKATPPQAVTSEDVQQVAAVSLAADRELLYAMFSDRGGNGPPLVRAPALYFVSDAMRSMEERLDAFIPYHNMGCRYAQCGKYGIKTELAAMYRVLSVIGNDASDPATGVRSFADALTDAKAFKLGYPLNFSSTWPLYADLFDQVAARHAQVIQHAVTDATGVTPYDRTLVALPDPAVPRPVLALQSEVVKANRRWVSFDETGLLTHDPGNALQTGLLASKISTVRDRVNTSVANLDKAIADYKSDQQRAVGDLIGQIDDRKATSNLEERAAALRARAKALNEDEQGLKIAATLDEARFADLAQAIRKSGASGRFVAGEPMAPISFNGRDGKYDGTIDYPVPINLRMLAKRDAGPIPSSGIVLTGAKGDVVTADVKGRYQPTCALTDLQGHFYGMEMVTDGLPNAPTGSYGYGMELNTGKMMAHEYSDSEAKAFWAKVEACITATTTAGISGEGVEYSLQACLGHSDTKTKTTTDTEGSQASTSAAFSVGVRLPNTPFPQYPVGALLAVLTKPNAWGVDDILSVQVVGEPSGSIVFTEPADLYLVVNDKACTSSGTSENLTVTLTKSSPLSGDGAGAQLQVAFGSVQAFLDQEQKKILDAGRILPGQMASLKDDAIAVFEEAGTYTLPTFPRDLAQFFGAWLDHKLRGIERQIELKAIHREMEQLLIEAKAIDTETGLSDTRGRYADLLPRLALRNLEYSNAQLTAATDRLVDATSNWLYPMVYLRYPETLSYLTGNTTRLLGLNWLSAPLSSTSDATSADTIARAVRNAAEDLLSALEIAVDASTDAALGDAKVKWIAVHFPNPWNPPEPPDAVIPQPGAFVDSARATAVWDSILQGLSPAPGEQPRQIQFEIRPEDIYRPGSGNATEDGLLSCKAVAPSIRAMAAYLVTPLYTTNADISTRVGFLNSLHYTRDGVVKGQMQVPTLQGVEEVLLENPDFLEGGAVSTAYGAEYEIFKIVRGGQGEQGIPQEVLDLSVQGVSPFTQFQVLSFNGMGDPWWVPGDDVFSYPDGNLRITDFVVVMQLEYRAKGQSVKGVATCP